MNKKSRIAGLMCVAVMMLMGINSSVLAQDNMNMNSKMAAKSSMDQKFMMRAASGGMAEIEMARAALQKSRTTP
jgi:predicted outer membrane protein